MADGDNILMTTSWGVGTTLVGASLAIGGMSADTATEQLSSGIDGLGGCLDSTGEFSETVMDAADGNTAGLTTVFGLLSLFSGSSSAAEPDSIVVFFRNQQPYNVVERKAQAIYDKYNDNHVRSLVEGTSLIASPEVGNIVNDIVANTKSKEELLTILTAMEEFLTERPYSVALDCPKVKKITYGKNK